MIVINCLASCLCMAVCASVRTFASLLFLCLVCRFSTNLTLFCPEQTKILTSDTSLYIIGVAAIIEVLSDFSPMRSAVLGPLMIVLRPAAAALCILSIAASTHPSFQFQMVAAVAVGLLICWPLLTMRHQYINLRGAQRTYQATGLERIFLPLILQPSSNSPVLNTVGSSLIESGLVVLGLWSTIKYPLFLAPIMLITASRTIFKQIQASRRPQSNFEHKFVRYYQNNKITEEVVSSSGHVQQDEFFSSQADNNSNSQVIYRR
ncbi:MAG: DUF4126 family protein [Candidatus Bruticola sp.]